MTRTERHSFIKGVDEEEKNKYRSDEEKEAEKHEEAKQHAANFSRDGGAVTANFSQLSNLMIVAEGIMKVYNELFLNFPTEAQDKDSEAELEKVYVRIKEFVQGIVNKKEELFKEMDYQKAHLEAIGFSRDEVMEFYDFKLLWQNLENEADPYD